MRTLSCALLAAASAISLPAQANTIVGLDGRLTAISGPTLLGRRGIAHPDGEVGLAFGFALANTGTVPIPCRAPMRPDHPMVATMIVREANGRFEQITTGTTFVMHAGPADPQAAANGEIAVGASDVRSAAQAGDRHLLAPASEIDPWLCAWRAEGSYFDRGEPAASSRRSRDGNRSLQGTAAAFTTDAVKNRVTVLERDLLAAGRTFVSCHVLIPGEAADRRGDNVGHREFTRRAAGGRWTLAAPAPWQAGSVLAQWHGATLAQARNGDDDGHFVVAVQVTRIAGALHHYEYAVHNLDNHRGGASVRIPVHPTAPVTNLTFRDANDDTVDDWTVARRGAELVFTAPPHAPLSWNHLYNFGFDCDLAPEAGCVLVDQARPGPGGDAVRVPARVPSAHGTPAPVLTSTAAEPRSDDR